MGLERDLSRDPYTGEDYAQEHRLDQYGCYECERSNRIHERLCKVGINADLI